jgi:muramidase (phage lysozyme)
MDRMAWAGAAIIMGGAAWYYYQAADASTSTPAADTEPDLIEEAMSQVSNIATSVADKLADPQVLAFLALIRTGEGTTGVNGYRTMFGGGLFTSFADHPRTKVTRSGYTSSAAGAYQFLPVTWDEMAAKYDLPDFGPASQDVAAVGLIKRRGALADVLAGRFRAAIAKCNKEWASLPGSPYGQPTLTYTRAQNVLLANGANIVGTVA